MRRRRLKKLIKRLRELQQQNLTRDELLLKLGAARKEAGKAYALLRAGPGNLNSGISGVSA